MALQRILLFNAETDTTVEIEVTPENATRIENDLTFASNIMNEALQKQSNLTSTSVTCSQEQSGSTETASFTSINEMVDVGEDEQVHTATDGDSLYRWTTPCVLLLLETYKEMEDTLHNGKQPQKRIWEHIANVLGEKGYIATGPQCAAKMRSLKKTYKAIKDHNSKSGKDRRNWQFLQIMGEIFARKAWSMPVAVASSTGLSIQQDEGGSTVESDSSNSSRLSTSKVSIASLLGKRIKQKEEHEEAKAKRHRERLEMDTKLLETLQKIIEK